MLTSTRPRWLSILGIALAAIAFLGGLWLGWLLHDLPAPTASNLRAIRPSTYILDRNGQLLYEVIQDEGRHSPQSLDEIPPACWQATLAVEDSRFFRHPGFDPLAIVRAAWQNWRQGSIVSGASTLTQQLARNTLMSPSERFEPTLRRKLREAWLAWRIEQRFDKEEILALYLNQVYYGNFSHGLEAAAQSYLGKSAQELDLAECSLLAGLLQNPAAYNPLQNLEAARWRQATVLNRMVSDGYINRQEAELALAESLQFAASPFSIQAPHFVSYVESQLERLVGTDLVSQGGLRVTTTLDGDVQRQAEDIVVRRLAQLAKEPNAPKERKVENAAVVVLEPATGAIRVMVGSPDYFDPEIDGAVNGAVARRQPGSAIKPITYAAAMDPTRASAAGREPLTAATIIADVKTSFLTAENEPYVPENYDRTWHGPVSTRTALASSYNTPAVKVLEQIGIDALIDQARRQGITSFTPGQSYGLALTLGGGEVSLLELTGAYAAFANGGYRIEPYAIERVEDQWGNTLFQAPHISTEPILDPRVAYLVTDILSDDNARAPAFGRNSVLKLSRPAAVKTGTTTDWRDNWTLGYTPDLVTGVWVGNADNAPMLNVSGVAGAGPIWHDVMELVHRNRTPTLFQRPDGLVRSEICIDSGFLPTQWCTRRRSELFIAGTEPAEFDTVYRPVLVDGCGGEALSSQGTAQCQQTEIYRVYPPELQAWALAQGIPQPEDAAAVGDAEKLARTGSAAAPEPRLSVISPAPNSVLRLSKSLPEELQRVRIAVRLANMGSSRPRRVTFLLNDQPIGQATAPPYEIWWSLQRGSYLISATAESMTGQMADADPVWIHVE